MKEIDSNIINNINKMIDEKNIIENVEGYIILDKNFKFSDGTLCEICKTYDRKCGRNLAFFKTPFLALYKGIGSNRNETKYAKVAAQIREVNTLFDYEAEKLTIIKKLTFDEMIQEQSICIKENKNRFNSNIGDYIRNKSIVGNNSTSSTDEDASITIAGDGSVVIANTLYNDIITGTHNIIKIQDNNNLIGGGLVKGEDNNNIIMGWFDNVVTVGDNNTINAKNYSTVIAGKGSMVLASYNSKVDVGDNSMAMGINSELSVGKNSCGTVRGSTGKIRIKGEIGSVLTICEEVVALDGIKYCKSFIVDGKEVKANTYYTMNNGILLEAKEKED